MTGSGLTIKLGTLDLEQVSGILMAQERGFSLINNSTSVENTAILSLNEKLGFTSQSEWVEMEKIL